MGALEQRGLLTQPHTSAGRIPSQQGYRIYVDQLLPAPGAAALQLEKELAGLSLQWAALDDLLLHLARRLADLTGLLSLISRPQRPRPLLQGDPPGGEWRPAAGPAGEGPAQHQPQSEAAAGLEEELPILERWTNDQLRASAEHPIPWHRLPEELRRSGGLLRQALESHLRIRRSRMTWWRPGWGDC